ncbi:hypothetical protein MNBD_PLANCTO02-199 [hydrothermal vent metagenome]|uniref:STAS domain-containing protein n=1 Tax=hydrothermal vent metagenome TaxID=652676 RepID=A0A3B1CZT4_9ZZZZ
MNEQNCQLENLGGCSIVTLSPQANDLEWSEFDAMGNSLVSTLDGKSAPNVLVDLTKLDYIGSALVALVVRIWKKVESQQGNMVVANSHELVYEVLNLAGLTKVWMIVETREEGMKHLGAKSGGAAGSVGFVMLGLIFVIGALAGLGILISDSTILDEKIAMIITFVFATLGIITGTLTFAKSASTKRWVGAGIVMVSLAVAVAGVIKFPVIQIVAPPQKQQEENKVKQNKVKENSKKNTELKSKPPEKK